MKIIYLLNYDRFGVEPCIDWIDVEGTVGRSLDVRGVPYSRVLGDGRLD